MSEKSNKILELQNQIGTLNEQLKNAKTKEEYNKLLEDYNKNWLGNYIKALMSSKYKDEIAIDWAKDDRRKKVACFILGALVDGGVLIDNYADVAKAYILYREKRKAGLKSSLLF